MIVVKTFDDTESIAAVNSPLGIIGKCLALYLTLAFQWHDQAPLRWFWFAFKCYFCLFVVSPVIIPIATSVLMLRLCWFLSESVLCILTLGSFNIAHCTLIICEYQCIHFPKKALRYATCKYTLTHRSPPHPLTPSHPHSLSHHKKLKPVSTSTASTSSISSPPPLPTLTKETTTGGGGGIPNPQYSIATATTGRQMSLTSGESSLHNMNFHLFESDSSSGVSSTVISESDVNFPRYTYNVSPTLGEVGR